MPQYRKPPCGRRGRSRRWLVSLLRSSRPLTILGTIKHDTPPTLVSPNARIPPCTRNESHRPQPPRILYIALPRGSSWYIFQQQQTYIVERRTRHPHHITQPPRIHNPQRQYRITLPRTLLVHRFSHPSPVKKNYDYHPPNLKLHQNQNPSYAYWTRIPSHSYLPHR